MALLTQEQADQAYLNAQITKFVDDLNPSTKCIWHFDFMLDGENYAPHQIDETVLSFGSTDLEVKTYFIDFLKANCEYLTPAQSYTEEVVSKV